MTDTINAGERRIDAQHRVLLGKDICEAHGIRPDDRVEVWVKAIRTDDTKL